MKYYVIAGEASGDLHASNLLRELKQLDRNAAFRAWGGNLMQDEGAHLVKHYRDLAFMGFIEVVANIRTIFKNIHFCKEDILAYQPDVLILVDYPGFNLRIAKWAKEQGIKVFYYISPQIWAWKQSRVHLIKKVVDRMFVILPFEKSFYQSFDYNVDFVGHPLLDAINKRREAKQLFQDFCVSHGLSQKPIVALLPGSRKQEISVMLPLMLKMQQHFSDYQFVIAGAPSQMPSFYASIPETANTTVLYGKTYELLEQAHAAMVTSGTATLETALFNVPQVVCYKGSAISYHIARQLIKVKYISLVNLIMDKPLVKELIQQEFNEKCLREELDKIIRNETYRTYLLDGYNELREKLGNAGASQRTAQLMFNYLVKN